jgi:hypothetical protein
MKTRKVIKFETIVRQYRAMRKNKPDRHIEHCINQKNLSDAIEIAAKAINERGKRHNHQRRIRGINLNNLSEKLKTRECRGNN